MFGLMVSVGFLIPPLTKVSEVESCDQQDLEPVASAVLEWWARNVNKWGDCIYTNHNLYVNTKTWLVSFQLSRTVTHSKLFLSR